MKTQNVLENHNRDLKTRIRELEANLQLTEDMADRHEKGKDEAAGKIEKQDFVLQRVATAEKEFTFEKTLFGTRLSEVQKLNAFAKQRNHNLEQEIASKVHAFNEVKSEQERLQNELEKAKTLNKTQRDEASKKQVRHDAELKQLRFEFEREAAKVKGLEKELLSLKTDYQNQGARIRILEIDIKQSRE
jgi:chromosome segregation ATPase